LNSGVVTVARASVGFDVQRFTIAHELAHHELQGEGAYLRVNRTPGQQHQHANNREELEADAFAEFLLMPEKAVRSHFHARFRRNLDRKTLDDTGAFLLSAGRQGLSDLRRMELRKFARLVGTASSFGGPQFEPLNRAFKVSASAMAERLITLGLVS
jgi:Zn-dependent peptidase ImmA (M78 family)